MSRVEHEKSFITSGPVLTISLGNLGLLLRKSFTPNGQNSLLYG